MSIRENPRDDRPALDQIFEAVPPGLFGPDTVGVMAIPHGEAEIDAECVCPLCTGEVSPEEAIRDFGGQFTNWLADHDR